MGEFFDYGIDKDEPAAVVEMVALKHFMVFRQIQMTWYL